ncbi:MAG: ABC transporter ATP-binding protein [Acidimicrobiia bacterium]
MPSLLEVREITKAYGGLVAVNQASFAVNEGTITALIGPNGAGKTTAFDVICGIVEPGAGTVLHDGVDMTGWLPHRVTRRGIGRTFQITRELGDLTVLENVVVPSATGGIRKLFGPRISYAERTRAMDLLTFVGIERLCDQLAKSLSYGQRKLLEFASVLMGEPRLVLLDEPAGGVNPALLERIMDRIRTLNTGGTTFLIVEHNMDVVMRLSHSVIVMAHGEVILQGPPDQVRADHRVLDAYLGKA